VDLTHATLVKFGSTRLALLAERAVADLASQTLYLADLHIGKSATFRAAAIPIPDGDTTGDLLRLSRAIERTGARKLVVLGDFLHASPGLLNAEWKPWRRRHSDLEVLVVRGNHDQHSGDPPRDWQVRMVDEPFRDGEFVLRHLPEPDPSAPVLAGHLHPSVRLRGGGRDRVSLPCFHFSGAVAVLPAFTSFSGGYPIRAAKDDRVYAIADDAVIEVSRLAM
jgi:uncharacterized protein